MSYDPLPNVPTGPRPSRETVCDVCGQPVNGIAWLVDHYKYRHKGANRPVSEGS